MGKNEITSVTVEKKGNVSILHFSGELSYANLEKVKENIRVEHSFSEIGATLLDLSAVNVLDSSGIGLLVSLYKSALKVNGRLVIAAGNSMVGDILKTVGVNRVITVFPKLDEAMTKLQEA